jgi:hypothetical protein
MPRDVRRGQATDESMSALAAAMMSPSPLAGAPAPAATDDGAFDEFVASVRHDETMIAAPRGQTRPDPTAPEPSERKGAACIALITSLHTTGDRKLRCEIANALGSLGDKQAVVPLERLMHDADVQVRRAAAEALVRLGHPKGKALLSAAEKKPKAPLALSGGTSKSKLAGTDRGSLIKLLGALAAVLLLAGGIWMWMSSGPPQKKSTKKGGKKAKVTVSQTQNERAPQNESPTQIELPTQTD